MESITIAMAMVMETISVTAAGMPIHRVDIVDHS
jgi:hypothetical protein